MCPCRHDHAYRPRGSKVAPHSASFRGYKAAFPIKAMRGLRVGDKLAAALGEKSGRCEVLFQILPPQRGQAWLSCVP